MDDTQQFQQIYFTDENGFVEIGMANIQFVIVVLIPLWIQILFLDDVKKIISRNNHVFYPVLNAEEQVE